MQTCRDQRKSSQSVSIGLPVHWDLDAGIVHVSSRCWYVCVCVAVCVLQCSVCVAVCVLQCSVCVAVCVAVCVGWAVDAGDVCACVAVCVLQCVCCSVRVAMSVLQCVAMRVWQYNQELHLFLSMFAVLSSNLPWNIVFSNLTLQECAFFLSWALLSNSCGQ